MSIARSGWAKRGFDLVIAVPVSIVSFPICVVLIAIASIDTRSFGLFRQRRIGRYGRPFTLCKIRSMRVTTESNTVTVTGDSRVTSFGAVMRRLKLDELPQFWSVSIGHMSLVGPRPDVAGYADELRGNDRDLLRLRPGITGPATLLFRNEEAFLARQDDPTAANDTVVWPTKVAVNRAYQLRGSWRDDFAILDMTLRGTDMRLRTMLESWDETLIAQHSLIEQLLAFGATT